MCFELHHMKHSFCIEEVMNDSAERACDGAYESMVNICYNSYQLIYVLNIVVHLHIMYHKKILFI